MAVESAVDCRTVIGDQLRAVAVELGLSESELRSQLRAGETPILKRTMKVAAVHLGGAEGAEVANDIPEDALSIGGTAYRLEISRDALYKRVERGAEGIRAIKDQKGRLWVVLTGVSGPAAKTENPLTDLRAQVDTVWKFYSTLAEEHEVLKAEQMALKEEHRELRQECAALRVDYAALLNQVTEYHRRKWWMFWRR